MSIEGVNDQPSPGADAPTLAGIAILSGVSMMVVHEILGHGLATLLLGAHVTRVTSVDESWNGDLSDAQARCIAAAGIGSNILWGLLALVALRRTPQGCAPLRYFLLFFGHATLFMGSGYLFSAALFGFGDVQQVLRGVPAAIIWRVAAAAAGFLIYRAALLDAAKTLDGWAGEEQRAARLRVLTLRPYLALGVAATLSGVLSPQGPLAGVAWSAAATFGACAGFAFVPALLERGTAPPAPLDVTRSWVWIAAGALALMTLFGVLAPGVPR